MASKKDYQARMAHALLCESQIKTFQNTSLEGSDSSSLDFFQKSPADWMAVINAYKEAFAIYADFNKELHAKALWRTLHDFFQTFDLFTSDFGIHLLLSVRESYQWLIDASPEIRQQLDQGLRRAIQTKLFAHEMDFWLLLNTRDFMRNLAETENERRSLDQEQCQTLILGAQLSFHCGNWPNAESWLRRAAQISKDRLGNDTEAGHLLQMISTIAGIRDQSRQNHSPEPSNIVQSLEGILQRSLQQQYAQRFLPSVDELVAEYAEKTDKFAKLIQDKRFTIHSDLIDERVLRYNGLLSRLPSQIQDNNGNMRGMIGNREQLIIQVIIEIVESITLLFQSWQAEGYLNEQSINNTLYGLNPNYSWDIYRVGIARYIQGDFISAIHVMIPQFENILRHVIRNNGIPTKKLHKSKPGEQLINDLINPQNTEVQQILGLGLYEVIYWYFVSSDSIFGYRHKMAHGWMDSASCNAELAAMTLWATMRVCACSSSTSI